jgi:hypothetical protein
MMRGPARARFDAGALRARVAIIVALVGLVACGGDESSSPTAPLNVPEGCNPIAFEHDCMLPYPSDLYRGGETVQLPQATWMTTSKDLAVDPHALSVEDGFSPGSQILVSFSQAIDEGALIGWDDDFAESLGDTSPTVLLDADTGERVMHFAETDPRAVDDVERALLIRPVTRLENGHRYVVAIRGLRSADGEPLATPMGFSRLRDGTAEASALTALAERYEGDVFAPLEAAGVARGELQLAWDFTVRSRNDAMTDMLAVREQTLAALDSADPEVTVVSFEDAPDAFAARRIEATLSVPRFLQDSEPMAQLLRDADDQVASDGTFDVPFTIWIPNSVANLGPNDPPPRIVQFSHGFFGGRVEVDSFVIQLADERGFVVVATDWWGLSNADRLPLTDMLVTDIARTLQTTDRVHQAMANQLALTRAAMTTLPSLSEMMIAPAYDASEVYLYGISMGHILGTTLLSLSPDIERAAVNVGGANFSMIMFRARPFLAFLAILNGVLPNALDQQKYTVLS